jgi:CSLREA domain-containing protein
MLSARYRSLAARPLAVFAALSMIATTLMLVAAEPASAVSFVVDSTADVSDANPGDGICATGGGQCTLRAAIEETNAIAGMDVVEVPAGTYLLDGQLVIEDSLFLTGSGAGTTILDGQGSTEVLRTKTVETLVCDAAKDRIASYDRNGQRNPSYTGVGSGGLELPQAMTESSSGKGFDIFVAGFTSGIHRYDAQTGSPEGVFVGPNGGGSPLGATDLVFAPPSVADGGLLVTSFQPGGGIRRFNSATGAYIDDFIPAGSGGLAFPNSIAIEGGDIYVTSTGTDEVLRYDGTTGAFVDDFVAAFSGGLSTPRNLLFHDGSLYVASEDNNKVLRYNGATGAFIETFVDSGSGGLDGPLTMDFGPDGSFYVLSKNTDQVLRYDGSTGDFIDVFIEDGDVFLDSPSCFMFRDFFGDGPIVNISGLTLSNGQTVQAGGPTSGLMVDRGSAVTMSDSRIRDNTSSSFGGGIQNWGILTLRRVEVTGNALPEGGGGQTSQGGGIFNSGNLDIEDSLIYDNYATRGGGISNVNDGSIDLINSTISGNRANGAGGGIRNVGDARIDITFSTITGNRANEPGGAGEPDRFGGGIFNKAPAIVQMGNSILAGNEDNRFSGHADSSPDCYNLALFDVDLQPDNIIGVVNGNCVLPAAAGLQSGTDGAPLDPQLAPIAFNGAATRTHRLLPSSPAIDANLGGSSSTFYDCDDHDQRQQPRPIDGDIDGFEVCDLGAYEYQPPNDGDGLSPAIEDLAPNGGDGNSDGIPDRLQPSVASLPNAADGEYVTLVASEGSVLSDVAAVADPSGGSLPPMVLFPIGNFSFEVTANPTATVELLLPAGVTVDDYYKFGGEPGDPTDHWYLFANDGTTGAIILPNKVVLKFVDGDRGDDDLTVNGVVVEPGGPTVPDSDEDGLSDDDEVNIHGTDPLDADTDNDGLEDGAEVLTYATDPLDPDTDDDGLVDGLEVAAGVDPLDDDSDDDGVRDGLDVDVVRGVVQSLDDAAFKAPGHRKAIEARLESIEKKIAKAKYAVARRKLVRLRAHVNGCGTTPDRNDWIRDCEAQILVHALVDSMIANVGG